ncbi:dTDP-glucose 4,6-dehydratase [Chlorociboria aeruginascens]|nr:dTDP-glucose 4,6-dehydratase [Chlorociboria aeruginascens]
MAIKTNANGGPLSPISPNGEYKFSEESGIWKEAPILIGSTKFEPLPDVKNIMITGGAGFIACWLVRHLTLTYPDAYNIISFDKLDYCASLNNTRILNDKKNFTFYHGDITHPSEVMDCLEKHNIDTIFHFAAQSHVDLSFGNSYAFTHTNVYGTHVLLESAKKVGIKKFIHISTDEVYGEVGEDDEDLLEHSLLAPTNPYAASKAAAEMLVQSYQKSFKLPVIIVRSNNVYGPHQYPEKVIPKFSCLLLRKQPLVLHGDGTPTRRYLYAGDAADAFDTILHRGAMDQIYNVGSYDEISNLTLCSKLLTFLKIPHHTQEELHRWVKHTHDRAFNDHRYAVDGSKLRQLGWEQKTTFADGMAITVDWYAKYGERWWGDITKVLTPFPIVSGKTIIAGRDAVEDIKEDFVVDGKEQMMLAKNKQGFQTSHLDRKRKFDEANFDQLVPGKAVKV